jgi:hypothetical protein
MKMWAGVPRSPVQQLVEEIRRLKGEIQHAEALLQLAKVMEREHNTRIANRSAAPTLPSPRTPPKSSGEISSGYLKVDA